MQVHNLKILPQYYSAAASGSKPFELRKNDRNFQIGDNLHLKEWNGEYYTGREVHCYITYIFKGGQFGLDKDYCILGTRIINCINRANAN